jgi:phosphoribosylanthranilate isomerase
VATEVKFCGLTRPEDARVAVESGASYLGVIFAGGPRMVDAARAREILAGAPARVKRVGVFGTQSVDEIARTAEEAGLDLVQLHADPDSTQVHAVRARTGRMVWGVLRIEGSAVPARAEELFVAADAVVVDAKVPGALGGTGTRVDWLGVRDALADARGRRALVLAGGLNPDVVGEAIAALAPRAVDVSSGVERAPGIKDHARMRAFMAAVARRDAV